MAFLDFIPNSKLWKRKLKRAALAHGVVLVHGFDPTVDGIGTEARDQIVLVQKSYHLEQNGKLDVETRNLLNRFPDPAANGKWTPNGTGQPSHLTPSGALAYWARETAQYAWRYTEGGARFEIVDNKIHNPRQNGLWSDCSSGVTDLYWLAGLPDPNGLGYNGQGYTGTLIVHGKSAPSFAALPTGGMVFYSTNGQTSTHVAMKIDGSNVWSHGGDPGPSLIPYNYRSDIFAYRDHSEMWK